MDPPPAADICIYLLGRFQITLGGHAVVDAAWRRARAASLVKVLALAPQHRLHRDQVMELLWPDSAPRAGINSLHQVIHVTRRILQSERVEGSNLLRLRQEVVSLESSKSIWVDAEEFEITAAQARTTRDPIVLQSALDLYRGDLLPDDLYAEWTVTRRDALQRAHIELLLDLAGIHAEAKEFRAAGAALRRVLETDSLHEEAHAGLMRIYALSGQRHSALQQYRALQEALTQDLGATPQQATQQLYEAICSSRFPPETPWS